MEIQELKNISLDNPSKKLLKSFKQYDKLLIELRKKELTLEIIKVINADVETINSSNGTEKELIKLIRTSLSKTLNRLEKELKIVTKNHFQTSWMAIGMSVFGIPLGAAFGASQDNMAFIGVGIPIGMVIGMAIGASMDKKALKEGRQLDIAIEL